MKPVKKMASDSTLSTTSIDDLPDALLLHIISFLPAIDAISSSAVCSKWRNLWHLIPTLDFSIFSFTYRLKRNQPASEIRFQVAKFVSNALLLRRPLCSPLNELSLSFDYKDYDRYQPLVDLWVKYAVDTNCKVLSLKLKYVKYYHTDGSIPYEEDIEAYYMDDSDDEEDEYGFHYCTYHFSFDDIISSSVEVLKLKGSGFRLPSVSITSLKSLYLMDFDEIYDVAEVSQLVSLCVNLESLSVHGAHGRGNLKIVSPKLKHLTLSDHMESDTAEQFMEICAPNLQVVSLDSFCVGKYIFQDTTSLVEASIKFSLCGLTFWAFACWCNLASSFTGVECLTVPNMWIWYKTMRKLKRKSRPKERIFADCPHYGKIPLSEDILSKTFAFSNLKFLTLLTGYSKRDLLGLELCLEMCPKLEYLDLENPYGRDLEDDLTAGRPITLRMQNVRQVTMKMYEGTRNELYVVGLLKKHQVVLEKIIELPGQVWKRLEFSVTI